MQKKKLFGNSVKRRIVSGLLIITGVITTCSIASAYYSDKITQGISDRILRLHVVANSDSDEDQALKRQIRDDLLIYMKENMGDNSTLDQSKKFVNDHISDIEKIAQSEIEKNGKTYGVKAYLGNFDFPTKVYGDIALPSGNYQALRVVLGEGAGANWWCVLFPPLCFVDATHGTVPDSVKNDLKDVLTEDEYAIITTADSEDDIPVKLKFKIVEFFEDGKVQVAGMIKKFF